ncbi:multiple epidermal growth factor-like domains protein 10 [Ostrea edulis]|uniref:multiple epidermal growth factor-like domains protein 10 n=1 Tax=Ostrea edulis TaxID=37623 RepID=UPI0024AF82E5|nr:multiple epidermal growth factor-like domains protein 10 [Ostrea edulis]
MGFRTVALLHVSLGISLCYENLSKDRTAVQSTTWTCPANDPTCTTYLPSNAVDGDISTCIRTEWIGYMSQYKTVWWYVDLGDIKSVYNIRIQFRDYGQQYEMRQRGRMAGFSLYLSNTSNIENGYLCYKAGPDLPPLDFSTTCVSHGRYVIFYNERQPGVQYPAGYELTSVTELCEVTVLGCMTTGRYGQECELICSSHCQEQRCHIVDGTCLGCIAGWTGNFCNKTCPNGYYGMECESECLGHCRDGVSCNHTSGNCDNGCGDGWQGAKCDQACLDGWYGPNCIYTCSGNCRNNAPCDKTNGTCQSCKPEYAGNLCNNSCPERFYGDDCSTACNDKCLNNECHHESGLCNNGCKDGYQGPFCNESCDYSWYGKNCSMECNTNCVNKSCHHITGKCQHGCRPGWIGSNCSQACDKGLYGPNCSETCSEFCKVDTDCNHVDGNCSNGCRSGYTGSKCDRICDDKWYGENCSIQCGKDCVNQSCDHIYGECSCGCTPGWMGKNCSQECTYRWYGENCLEACSGNCAENTTCNRFNGTCPEGCETSFTGEKCDRNIVTAPSGSSASDVPYGYIAGLVVSIIFNVFLCGVLIATRRHYTRKGEKCSPQYVSHGNQTTVTTDDTHTYQELNISANINSYQNLSFGSDL